MVVEAAINLWLANTLIQEGLVLEYRAIIVMLIMPSVVNPLVWLGLKSHYKISGYVKHSTVVEVLKVMNCARQMIYIFRKLMISRML